MTTLTFINLVIGCLLLYIAFSKHFRPMSWSRFWFNIAIGVFNLGAGLYILFK